VIKRKRFPFTLENVRVCYILNRMRQAAVPSFRPSTGKQRLPNFSRVVSGCEFLILLLYDILCVLCLLLCKFVHFMPFIVCVCTALLPLGVKG